VSAERRVLVVDDDDSIRDFVVLALAEEGYEVLTAPDGRVALDTAAARPPALILLDMRMPVMDGWAFASAYRALPPPHAPIAVLTAARDAARYAAEIEADAHLAKPFGLAELSQLVARFVPAAPA
jgi:two-component system, chemotaxis family, chemotaxis protein CheY